MDSSIPFASTLFADMVGTARMRRVWTEENTIGAWIRVHRALVEAQVALDLVPACAAAVILEKLTKEHVTLERLRAKQQVHVHLMVSFLKAFREICGEAAEHFYVGPTTQDILDTALTLQMADAHRIILEQAAKLEQTLCDRALRYRDTAVSGRSHQQHTVPTTFGFVLATWASEVSTHLGRAHESEPRWQLGSLSGISGAQNALVDLHGVHTARRLQEEFCAALGLGVPTIDLHARMDRFVEVVNHLAELCGSLATFATNLVAWQRPEVGEVEAPYEAEQYSSSTSPEKVNPESLEHVVGLAALTRGFAHALGEVRMLDNRDGTRLPVEFVAIPQAYLMVSRALATVARCIAGLRVKEEAMRDNLGHPNLLGQAVGERVMIELYRLTGRRDWAHSTLHRCARQARERREPFVEVLLEEPEIAQVLSAERLRELCDLTTYTGSAAAQTEAVVAEIRAQRARCAALR